MAATLETVTLEKLCGHCGKPIPRGHNYRTKKFCSRPCYNATKPYSLERAKAAFWSRVNMKAPNGCWEYTGARDKWGYGDIQFLKKHVQAHRLSWKLLRGEPGELDVLHKCHNPPCCNPAHLYLGTDVENSRDRVLAGRHAVGEQTKRNVLTEAQAIEILTRSTGEWGEGHRFAKAFRVAPNVIQALLRGQTWKHLPRHRPPTRFARGRRVQQHAS
jgi:hypothetical protein